MLNFSAKIQLRWDPEFKVLRPTNDTRGNVYFRPFINKRFGHGNVVEEKETGRRAICQYALRYVDNKIKGFAKIITFGEPFRIKLDSLLEAYALTGKDRKNSQKAYPAVDFDYYQ